MTRLRVGLFGDESAAGGPRVMFYSHDSYGLGHFRRTLTLASFLRSRRALSQLIVTGSPLAHRYELPAGCDFVKLPSAVKVAAGRYAARTLAVPFDELLELRRELLLGAARMFRPSVLVVDNVPGGLKGELVPTLDFLSSTSCRLVLGLRDVVDEAAWVREAWMADGSYELLDRLYDRILVYGEREIYDPVADYGFSDAAAVKTSFIGYFGREPGALEPKQVRAALGVDSNRLVLVMAGGGEDGYELLRMVLAALAVRASDSFACVLLGGPLLPAENREHVRDLAQRHAVAYLDFVGDVASYIRAADAVVSMGGYNSVCELLSVGKSALIVPRIRPRREQLIRARLLSERGLVRMLDPRELTPTGLLDQLRALLDERRPPARLLMHGLPGAAAAVGELLDKAAEAEPRAAVRGGRG